MKKREKFSIIIEDQKTDVLIDSKEFIDYEKKNNKDSKNFFLINKAIKKIYNDTYFWVGNNNDMRQGTIFSFNKLNDLVPISKNITVSITKI